MIAGAMLFIPITLSGIGTRARVVSSAYTSCSRTVAPRPPYSCGQETAAHPASAIVAFHARRFSKAASSFPRWRPAATTSSVRFAANHARNSLRTCSTSGGYEKSTLLGFLIYLAPIDCGQAGLYVGTDIWSTRSGEVGRGRRRSWRSVAGTGNARICAGRPTRGGRRIATGRTLVDGRPNDFRRGFRETRGDRRA